MLNVEHITPILNVSSVPASMAWFEKLGWKRSFAWNQVGMIANAADRDDDGEADYGGVVSGHVEIFLCLGAQGSRGSIPAGKIMSPNEDPGGVWMTWWLSTPAEVETMYSKAMQLGISIVMPLTVQPWNATEFRIRHPDGHTFRISAFLDND
jgi:hypothetical protein